MYNGTALPYDHPVKGVLGQFWTKIITLKLYSSAKFPSKATKKISHEFYQKGLTRINFSRIFQRRSIKIRKNG